MRKVLNVGGGFKQISLPTFYDGWEHILLDIDPTGQPDVVCDARELSNMPPGDYDAVYCSHNLEHYFRHDVGRVLTGFLHMLSADGFAHIRVPDIGTLIQIVAENNLDIDDVVYTSNVGPITARDVLYGYGPEIQRSGSDFYAHKTGFTVKSLTNILLQFGFRYVYTTASNLEIAAFAFSAVPTEFAAELLSLPRPLPADGPPPIALNFDGPLTSTIQTEHSKENTQ